MEENNDKSIRLYLQFFWVTKVNSSVIEIPNLGRIIYNQMEPVQFLIKEDISSALKLVSVNSAPRSAFNVTFNLDTLNFLVVENEALAARDIADFDLSCAVGNHMTGIAQVAARIVNLFRFGTNTTGAQL